MAEVACQGAAPTCGVDGAAGALANEKRGELGMREVDERGDASRTCTPVSQDDFPEKPDSDAVSDGSRHGIAESPVHPWARDVAPVTQEEDVLLLQENAQNGQGVAPASFDSSTEESAEVLACRLRSWREAITIASQAVETVCGISAEEARALAEDEEGCHPCCLVGPVGFDSSPPCVVHASRGMQAMTGYRPAFGCGKPLLRWLAMSPATINDHLNAEEESAFTGFCAGLFEGSALGGMTNLFLHQRASGQRFWNMLRTLKVETGRCTYAIVVMGELHLPPPGVLRDANDSNFIAALKQEKERWIVEEQCQDMDMASFSDLADNLRVFLLQMRSVLYNEASSLETAKSTATKSLLSFAKSHTSEFEGDHYVPLLGQPAAVIFEREVTWTGILRKVRNSLYRLYEVSEHMEEVVACAVSDPDSEDCPLVYISSEFENLTGYTRQFSIGRNCRFLQPNHSWRNQAFNSGELLMMREFCRDAKPESTRIINLLVNEHKEGFPFWNLLMMEHIRVEVDPSQNGGQEWRNYIFGVQTNLLEPASKLCELLAMDPSGLRELNRLRQVFRQGEYELGATTMQGYAKSCFHVWASGFPLHMDMPRFQVLRRDVAKKIVEGIPVVGLELTQDTIMEHFGAGLLDGVRHFYLTFSSQSGVSRDPRMDKIEIELLTLKLSQMLTSLRSKFLHYLKMGVTFTIVTPPNLVKHAPALLKSGEGYSFSGWLLDLRSASVDRDPCVSGEFAECWRSMTQACSGGLVQYLGICGSVFDLQIFDRACARLAKLSAREGPGFLCPVSVMGFDINPTLHASHLVWLLKLRSKVTVVAFNPGGAQNHLRGAEAIVSLAEECNVDPDFVLMKWASLVSDGICVPPVGQDSVVMQGLMRSSMRVRTPRSQQQQRRNSGGNLGSAQAWLNLAAQDAVVHRGLVQRFNEVQVERVRQLPALLDPSNRTPNTATENLARWGGVRSRRNSSGVLVRLETQHHGSLLGTLR